MGTGIDNIKKEKQENKRKLVISILKITLLAAIVVAVPLYIYFFHHAWMTSFKDFDDVVAYLEHYETQSIFVYIGLQILQVVISIIPGQVFQMAAGYLYGFWLALLYAMVGAVIGTGISFLLAKLLGRDFLHLFFGEEKMSYYISRLNSKRGYTLVFLLYLIPGIPKDVVSYAAGVSEIRFKPFLILSAAGRLPGMIGCLLFGMLWDRGNYIGMAIVAAAAVIAFCLCIVYRKKIDKYLDRIYAKISR
ncbi:MAG: TVP38/TMEM64 family protein [Anaerovoracaceae bacterium]